MFKALNLWHFVRTAGRNLIQKATHSLLPFVVREEKPIFSAYLKLEMEETPETHERPLTGKS